jgi:large subunit ribosomal protein L25
MATEAIVTASSRTIAGSSNARRLRKEGWLPGVVYDGKGQSILIQTNRHDFDRLLHRHTSANLLLDLKVDSQDPKKVLLKEVQHDPISQDLVHVDFVEISMTSKMRVRILLHLVGDPVGVTQDGGVLNHLLREVEVECLPGDLVEQIDVDVAGLHIGQNVFVRDLKVPAGFTVLTDGGIAIAGVAAPTEEKEPEAEAEAAAAAPTEPELIKKEKAEEGEAAEEGKEGAKPEKKAEKKAEKEKK